VDFRSSVPNHLHFASSLPCWSRKSISVKFSEIVDSLRAVYQHAAFMSLVFSYKNLSAPKAPRRFNDSLGQQCLYFLTNCISTKLNLPEGVAMGRILGFRNWNKRGDCMSAAATPGVLHLFTSIALKVLPSKMLLICAF